MPTIGLIGHLYDHYAIILTTYIAENDAHLQDPCNPKEPLKNLYKSINKCANYIITRSDPITKGQLSRILCGLVAEMDKIQEDCRTWWDKMEVDKTWMYFQYHSIKGQENMYE